jgi:hypothetical protein
MHVPVRIDQSSVHFYTHHHHSFAGVMTHFRWSHDHFRSSHAPWSLEFWMDHLEELGFTHFFENRGRALMARASVPENLLQTVF